MLELEKGKDVALLLSKHLLMSGKFYQVQILSASIFPVFHSCSADSELILYFIFFFNTFGTIFNYFLFLC